LYLTIDASRETHESMTELHASREPQFGYPWFSII